MSLREIARARRAIIRGETCDETELKQRNNVFQSVPSGTPPVKQDLSRKTGNNEACFTVSLPKGRNTETKLPDAVETGLAQLANMPCPARIDWAKWRAVVADAQRIVAEGWAAKALALGWPPLAVFGAVTDPMGDPYSDGLVVWLGGRELRAISATMASVKEGDGWSYFNRREQVGARLLWEIGNVA